MTRLVNGAAPHQSANLALDDLEKQGAETPVDVFNTSQYNPSSWDPTNWKPTLNTNVSRPPSTRPTEYSPTEYSAAFTAPDGVLAHGVLAHGVLAHRVLAHRVLAHGVLGDQFSRDAWASFNPADPKVFTAAQTASLLAVSAGPGTADESVSVNTWNNSGFFYIRVQGKNGSFDHDTAVLAPGVEAGHRLLPASSTSRAPRPLRRSPASRRSSSRPRAGRGSTPRSCSSRLATLAGRPDVAGDVVDVNAQPDGRLVERSGRQRTQVPVRQEPRRGSDQGDRAAPTARPTRRSSTSSSSAATT